VRIYLAGPLFTTPERDWNAALAARLEAAGHEVFLPQAHEPAAPSGQAIFEQDLAGLTWADTVVAITDGPDPDSGTAWECGYAYATGKRIVLFRSDFRRPGDAARGIPYNAMLIGSADVHLELDLAPLEVAADAILEALARLAD